MKAVITELIAYSDQRVGQEVSLFERRFEQGCLRVARREERGRSGLGAIVPSESGFAHDHGHNRKGEEADDRLGGSGNHGASVAPFGATLRSSHIRPDGGIGRRDGLKIRYPKGCVGSSPTPGTTWHESSPACRTDVEELNAASLRWRRRSERHEKRCEFWMNRSATSPTAQTRPGFAPWCRRRHNQRMSTGTRLAPL